MKKTLTSAAVVLALGIPTAGFSADSADIAELKRMIEEMRQTHEQQIQALEQRVEQAEARAVAAEEKAETTEGKIVAVEEQVQAKPRAGDNAFNPAISVVFQGGFASYSQDPEDYHF